MRPLILAVLLLFIAACGGDERRPDTAAEPSPGVTPPPGGALVIFEDHVIRAEIADEPEESMRGLMFRERLDDDAGMLFFLPFRYPGTHGFHMTNTLIPLTIAYMQMLSSDTYKVVAFRDMEPCPPETRACPTYPGGEPYDAAVEVNQGWFEEAGVQVGDTAVVRE